MNPWMENNFKMVKENHKNISLVDTSKQSDDNFKELAKVSLIIWLKFTLFICILVFINSYVQNAIIKHF